MLAIIGKRYYNGLVEVSDIGWVLVCEDSRFQALRYITINHSVITGGSGNTNIRDLFGHSLKSLGTTGLGNTPL